MNKFLRTDQSSILKNYYCRDCKWSIISVLCNHEMMNFKDAGDWDWWMYCSNKGCKNHAGEGYWQLFPEWAFRKLELE